MSCQQNQQQCQPLPKCSPNCPTPKCLSKCHSSAQPHAQLQSPPPLGVAGAAWATYKPHLFHLCQYQSPGGNDCEPFGSSRCCDSSRGCR
ncbi:late cornified envelope protein 2A-like [Pteronotus mesoamericanus]|uniref:late cornified envelope protein 2A-like n=1 Tax=Pteronotus mesoamericanus TaxID=1884717 RepID=UPI0023EAB033|nr:late cornified envelope protein 2A-like [Pteronotus parnellii mesoamericanus]